MLIADDNEARVSETLEKVGQQRASGLASCMRVDHIHLRLRRFEIAEIGCKR